MTIYVLYASMWHVIGIFCIKSGWMCAAGVYVSIIVKACYVIHAREGTRICTCMCERFIICGVCAYMRKSKKK